MNDKVLVLIQIWSDNYCHDILSWSVGPLPLVENMVNLWRRWSIRRKYSSTFESHILLVRILSKRRAFAVAYSGCDKSRTYRRYTKAPFTLRSIFGTARIKLLPVRYHFFGSWTTYLGSPRTKKWYGTKNWAYCKRGLIVISTVWYFCFLSHVPRRYALSAYFIT
jgi:hypothetical protein